MSIAPVLIVTASAERFPKIVQQRMPQGSDRTYGCAHVCVPVAARRIFSADPEGSVRARPQRHPSVGLSWCGSRPESWSDVGPRGIRADDVGIRAKSSAGIDHKNRRSDVAKCSIWALYLYGRRSRPLRRGSGFQQGSWPLSGAVAVERCRGR